MWGIFASLGSKIVGLLILVGAFFAAYFSIKQKGTLEERGKWEKATDKAKIELQTKVIEAVGKDAEIDASTKAKISKVEEKNKVPEFKETDDVFKF